MRDRTVSIQRRYGFACSQCRQKKIKCDGTKPSCRTCIKVHSLCTYKNNEGSTAHLRGELSRCRNQLISLEEKIRALTLASGEEKELLLQQLIGEVGSRADDAKIDKDIEHEENMSDSVDDENEDREQQNHQRITVDEHGNVCCKCDCTKALWLTLLSTSVLWCNVTFSYRPRYSSGTIPDSGCRSSVSHEMAGLQCSFPKVMGANGIQQSRQGCTDRFDNGIYPPPHILDVASSAA